MLMWLCCRNNHKGIRFHCYYVFQRTVNNDRKSLISWVFAGFEVGM